MSVHRPREDSSFYHQHRTKTIKKPLLRLLSISGQRRRVITEVITVIKHKVGCTTFDKAFRCFVSCTFRLHMMTDRPSHTATVAARATGKALLRASSQQQDIAVNTEVRTGVEERYCQHGDLQPVFADQCSFHSAIDRRGGFFPGFRISCIFGGAQVLSMQDKVSGRRDHGTSELREEHSAEPRGESAMSMQCVWNDGGGLHV